MITKVFIKAGPPTNMLFESSPIDCISESPTNNGIIAKIGITMMS